MNPIIQAILARGHQPDRKPLSAVTALLATLPADLPDEPQRHPGRFWRGLCVRPRPPWSGRTGPSGGYMPFYSCLRLKVGWLPIGRNMNKTFYLGETIISGWDEISNCFAYTRGLLLFSPYRRSSHRCREGASGPLGGYQNLKFHALFEDVGHARLNEFLPGPTEQFCFP
jgi:hypothetical protein